VISVKSFAFHPSEQGRVTIASCFSAHITVPDPVAPCMTGSAAAVSSLAEIGRFLSARVNVVCSES
jgi:hypothetical protein